MSNQTSSKVLFHFLVPKKRGKNYFGYKNHIKVEVKHMFIWKNEATDVAVHDSKVFEIILDETNTSQDVYADSAYRSAEHETELKALKFRAHLQRKGCRGRPLTSWEKQWKQTQSKTRSRIEHLFGAIVQRAGNVILRAIGLPK